MSQRSPPVPSSPSTTSAAPPTIDFGSSEALSQIRAITDVGTLNRLLHECIAFQRSLDLSLESLLSRRPDLDRQLTALLRSSPPLLDLAVTEAGKLLTSSESSATLASSLSSHVRHLDLAQSRVDSTLARVLASLDRSRALESARRALASDSPDLESAAHAVNSFLQIDINFPSEEDDLRRDMLDLKRRLETLIRKHLATAIDSRDHPSVLRLVRLFPLLSLSKEGLQTFVSYLKKVVSLRSRLDFDHLSELADSSGRPDFVGCLTSLFKDIVLAIEENDSVLRELSGDDGVGYTVCELQEECDSRGTQILRKYSDFRKLTRLANDINSYSKSNLLSVTTVIANAPQPGPDPREVETYLEEILTLTQLGEDYAEFMVSKIRGLGNSGSDIGSKGIKAIKFGSFSKMVQDLTGFYVIFEEFFMVENVRKAISIDELVDDGVTTSMVDDAFFVLQSCCRRAISTGSITSMLAVLAGATSLLCNEYQDALQQRLREPNLSAKLFLGGVGVQKTGTEIATALNNIDVSSEYVLKLRHEIEDLCSEAFPSQSDREKVKSCVSELADISNTFKRILGSGLDQLLQSISPRIRPVLDSVATVSYELSDSDYAENEVNDPWSQQLLHTIDSTISWLQPYLTTNNYDSLIHLLIDFVVKRLEVIMMQKRFSQLGGLQLDKEVRGLINHLSEMSQRPVRDKFSRLSQVATILNFERVLEILDFWGDNAGHLTWMLTPAEVRRVLGLRVDFRPEAIAALRL